MDASRFKYVEIRSKTISWEKILPSTIKDSFSVGAKIINAKTDVASVLKIFDPVGESSLFWLGEDLAAFNGIPTSTTVPTCQFKIWNPGGWLSSNNNK